MTDGGREYPARPLVGVGVVVLRPSACGPEVLLIRRGRPPALGQWSLPGGAQHLGETAEEAVRRELLEETGLTVGALHLAAHVDSIHRDAGGRVQYHYTILDFCALWCGGEAVEGGDADALCWAAESEYDALSLWQEARLVIAVSRRLLGL